MVDRGRDDHEGELHGGTAKVLPLQLEVSDPEVIDELLGFPEGPERSAHGEARATGNLGFVSLRQGEYGQARAQHERHLALAREIGDRREEGYATNNLGNALDDLASLADAEGDTEEARRLFTEALALQRELGARDAVGDTLVTLGSLELKQGVEESATAHLEEAWTLAREVKAPGTSLLSTVQRARLPGGDVEAALAALENYEQRVPHSTKMECRFRLWELTNDKAHLAEAKRLLDFAVEHAPEDCRTSMLESVPLHREIMRAWEEHGEKDAG